METKSLSLSTPCPCCQNRMVLSALQCQSCGTEVKGPIRAHEFMSLSEDDLQLLRIFLQFEGRIRDMEAPLGLSYPTIRSRISELKERLFAVPSAFSNESKKSVKQKSDQDILADLESGKISYDEALSAIRKNKKKGL